MTLEFLKQRLEHLTKARAALIAKDAEFQNLRIKIAANISAHNGAIEELNRLIEQEGSDGSKTP